MYNQIRILQHYDILKTIEQGIEVEYAPLHVRIETTESCNFKCYFCAFHNKARRDELSSFDFTGKSQLKFGRLLELIDEMAEVGTRAISFTGGGEPLVFPSMEEVLAKLREVNIRFAVTSNLAVKMSDTLINELAHSQWIRWSLSAGTPETYLKVTNPKATDPAAVFQRAKENVKRINTIRRTLYNHGASFNSSYVVCRENQNDIFAAAQLAKELGVDSIAYRPDTPLARQDEALNYSKEAKQALRKAQFELESKTFKVYKNENRLEDVRKLDDPALVCFYSNHTTYIAANGDVYPCCYTRSDSSYVMGNILNQSFKELWCSELRQSNYRKLIFNRCPSCPYGQTNQVLKSLFEDLKTADELSVNVEEKDYFI